MTLMTFVQLWNVTRRLCSSTITFPQTRYSTFAKTTLSWWKLWWLSWWSKRWWQWCSYRSAALLKNTKSFWLWWKNVFGWCARSPPTILSSQQCNGDDDNDRGGVKIAHVAIGSLISNLIARWGIRSLHSWWLWMINIIVMLIKDDFVQGNHGQHYQTILMSRVFIVGYFIGCKYFQAIISWSSWWW